MQRQLNRADTDMVDEINFQIVHAIEHYASQRFPWNQLTLEITTVADTAFYSTVEDIVTSTEYDVDKIVSIDSQFVVIDGHAWEIDLVDFDWQGYGSSSDVRTGRPLAIAVGTDRILVLPTPDTEYTIRLVGIVDINTIETTSIDSTTSPWLDRAEKMIRSKALSEIYKFYLHNMELGMVCQQEANNEFQKLVQDQERLTATGRIWHYGESKVQGYWGTRY